MYEERKKIYEQIERERNSKVLAYVTSDRSGASIGIMDDVVFPLSEHLHAIGKVNKISLILYTRGGYVTTAWNIINLIKEFCDELEVILPDKCHSSGTLIVLGANKIIMSHSATLSPIDPHIENVLGPVATGSNPPTPVPVDVESVKKYFSFLNDFLRIKKCSSRMDAFKILSDKINPIFIGDIYREQQQIRTLAKKLLSQNYANKKIIQHIISFLCDGNVAHDYTLHFTEAREMGFKVELPSPSLYKDMRAWLSDVSSELELQTPYRKENPVDWSTDKKYYETFIKRGFVESLSFAPFSCISKNTIIKTPYIDKNGVPKTSIDDYSTFNGWLLDEDV